MANLSLKELTLAKLFGIEFIETKLDTGHTYFTSKYPLCFFYQEVEGRIRIEEYRPNNTRIITIFIV